MHRNNTPPFTGLLQYIQKNTFIPDFLAKIQADDKKCEQLRCAIEEGNLNDDIFSDSNCYLYLLYLLRTEQIPYWHCITVYVYLIALMQFTYKQDVSVTDKDIKHIRSISLVELTKNGRVTIEGEKYLKATCSNLAEINYVTQYEELVDYAKTLPSVEQWLIKIPLLNKTNCDRELSVLLANLPFFPYLYVDNVSTNKVFYVPSSSMIHFFLKMINPAPMNMYPIFGNLKFDSVRALHKQNYHPIALYAPQVKSNPRILDGNRCGPFPMWLHDVAHTFWASMLALDDRNFIFNHYIPQLQKVLAEANQYNDKDLVKCLGKVINRAGDFDLTNIRQFKDPKTRFIKYLSRSFKFKNKVDAKISSCVEDRLLFLLLKMYYHSTLSPSEKEVWNAIFTSFLPNKGRDRTVFCRQVNIVKAIIQLAQSTCPNDIKWNEWFLQALNDVNIYPVNWRKILNVLTTCADPCEVWHKLDKESLVSLILKGHLHGFPPYTLPTQENLDGLKRLCHAKIESNIPLRQFSAELEQNKNIVTQQLNEIFCENFYFSTINYDAHYICFEKEHSFDTLVTYLNKIEKAKIKCEITGDAYMRWKFKNEGKSDIEIEGFFYGYYTIMPRSMMPDPNKIELKEPITDIQIKLAAFLALEKSMKKSFVA